MKKQFALFAAFLAVAMPARAEDETVLALPALNLGFATSYIAEGGGLWTKHGLKVRIVEIQGVGAMNAVLSKSADFSNSSGATILRANIRGQKVVAIANTFTGLIHEMVVSNKLAQEAGITRESSIEKRAQALKGKKIAINAPNAIPHGMVRLFGRKGGIDPERDITVAIMAPEASFAALKSGAIDAFVQSLPWSLIPPRQGFGTMVMSNLRDKPDFAELLPQVFNGIVTRPDMCTSKPTVCERLVAGYTEAMVWMHDKPKESLDILAKRMPGEDRGVLEEGFKLMVGWTPRAGRMDDSGWAKAQELMLIAGMIRPDEKLSSFSEIYTNAYIK
jgi:ABC-type nitrate/sulfonate/bicarbonate transport system substrate-binding protein